MSFKCHLCQPARRCDRCRSLNAEERKRQRSKDKAIEILESCASDSDPWLLPEDNVCDMQAVSVAVHGERPVRLTYRERVLAASTILAYGGTKHDVEQRLNLR